MWNLATGTLLLLIVTAVYLRRAIRARRSLAPRALPAGHPWSGLALLLIGLSMFAGGFDSPPSAFQPAIHIIATLGAMAWLIDDRYHKRIVRQRV